MRFLKKFEESQSEPEVGDYVLINSDFDDYFIFGVGIRDFIDNNIGQLITIDYSDNVKIEYENVPLHLRKFFIFGADGELFRTFRMDQVSDFAKTKEELEMKLNANKYNL